jgi:hypothetical protein
MKKILKSFKRTSLIATLFIVSQNFVQAQPYVSSCPYTITNNLSCVVTVMYEVIGSNCLTHVNCGPFSISIPPSGSVSVGSTFCCGGVWDVAVDLLDVDTPPQSVTCAPVSGGCAPFGTTQNGTIPSGATNCSGNWYLTWTATGCTINP